VQGSAGRRIHSNEKPGEHAGRIEVRLGDETPTSNQFSACVSVKYVTFERP
jgi:hypothetical protein